MPFKSQAQRRKFAAMVKTGEITQEQFNEWDKDTPTDLPEKTPKSYYPKTRRPRRLAK